MRREKANTIEKSEYQITRCWSVFFLVSNTNGRLRRFQRRNKRTRVTDRYLYTWWNVKELYDSFSFVMNSSLKFDAKTLPDCENNERKTPYRLCYRDKIRVINTRCFANEDEKLNSDLWKSEKPEMRAFLLPTKVNSVEMMETRVIQDVKCGNTNNGRVTSVERRTTSRFCLPYLLGEKYITPIFNRTTYGGFRTQQERKCLAFTRTLQLNHKQIFGENEKRLKSVLDISRPLQLQSRYVIGYPGSAR